MHSLDLYASIEEYLDFQEEIELLYTKIKDIVLSKSPTTLIDIGCGQGEFCKLLNTNNIKSFGVDLSVKQIEIAVSKGIDVACIDIKDIKDKYDCATAVFDVINYLPREEIISFLQHTYNLLHKNGYFIFDINSLFGFSEVAQGVLTIDLEDKYIGIDANFDDDILYTDISLFTKVGELYKKDFGTIEQYYYDNNMLEILLEEIGFIIEDIIPFTLHSTDQSDKFIFICKKD